MYSLIFLAVLAFVLAFVTTPLVRNLFRRWNIMDRPDRIRKIHGEPVPHAGGVAILLAYAASYAIVLALPLKAGTLLSTALPLTWRLVPAILLIFLTGLLDDLIGLAPWQKLLAQCVAAGGAFWAGIRLVNMGGFHVDMWASLPLTIAWLILCTNAMNLIDGLDGLAAGLGLFAAATVLAAAMLQHNVPLGLAAAPLAGALLGFLRYNFNGASIFLGDSGSLFIGFLLGCFGIVWSQKAASILGMTAPLMALSIPLLDTAIAIARRFLRKEPIFTADRGHIHHRLLARGFTQRKVTLILYACCVLGAICSIGVMRQSTSGVVIIVFFVISSIGVYQLGYREFRAASRMFIRGEFRKHIGVTLNLHAFEERLSAANTQDECWEVIQDASPGFGFRRIQMCLGGRMFGRQNGPEFTRSWNIRVPLSEIDYIELDRAFGDKSSTPVAQFVDVIRKALKPKLAAFNGLAPRYSASMVAETQVPIPARSCLFINQFSWPDSAATSQLLTDVAAQVAEDGHSVRVICGASSYADAEDLIPPRVHVDRCPALSFKRRSLGRIASSLSFFGTAIFYAFRGSRPDTVVTLTTPPGVGLIGALVSKARGASHYIWEMDVYPDIAVDLGVLRRDSLSTRVLTRLFDFARRRATGIVVLGEEMKDRLISHGIAEEKIHVCQNWADGREITPQPFPEGPIAIYYSGNLGMAHEVQTISKVMVRLRHDSGLRFIFAGGGSRRRALETFCRYHSISNVFFGSYCDRSDLGTRLSQGHIGLVTQLPESLGAVVPSKTYGIMAAGRPVLFIGPAASTPARIIARHQCGWHFEPEDVEGCVRLLTELSRYPERLSEAGKRARKAFEEHYDRSIGVARIASVLGLDPNAVAYSSPQHRRDFFVRQTVR